MFFDSDPKNISYVFKNIKKQKIKKYIKSLQKTKKVVKYRKSSNFWNGGRNIERDKD